MPDYAVFGGCLRSGIPFPELRSCHRGRPDWTLRTITDCPVRADAVRLGECCLDEHVFVRLYRFAGGYRLEYDDTGTFEVSPDGSQLVWWPRPNAAPEVARVDILGRVLSLGMHAAGTLCLHASAVALGDGAVAFLAPPFHGKSTLAMALTNAGARLITDDMLPVDPGLAATVRPGLHGVRLRQDSAERLAPDVVHEGSLIFDKHVVRHLPDDRLMLSLGGPLRALYLLAPVRAIEHGVAARRTRLPVVPAVPAVAQHATLAPLLGGAEGAMLFHRVAELVQTIPVYRLDVVRDLARISEVVAQVLTWHGLAPGLEPPARVA